MMGSMASTISRRIWANSITTKTWLPSKTPKINICSLGWMQPVPSASNVRIQASKCCSTSRPFRSCHRMPTSRTKLIQTHSTSQINSWSKSSSEIGRALSSTIPLLLTRTQPTNCCKSKILTTSQSLFMNLPLDGLSLKYSKYKSPQLLRRPWLRKPKIPMQERRLVSGVVLRLG